MDETERTSRAHDLDVTVWVGKHGIESVVDELNDQLADNDLVKVKFLRAARAGTETDTLAETLADEVNASLHGVRGHTAVFYR
ncbi:hypothetical protein C479_04322 [Halovivax asiaticus JCM 14624]|uniref:CRM domain-containing protein n=1 Tax=Halovivax asiaticus JCM 14624 TaxID=1227490 RepID=M0BNX8_9EURY|nr:YhbY family RNA-binding protein [Halovivax asiaticus]ELZ12591.1 hypothetical protein C479_04322 [Halovivax asiaticus JCM 14624]